MHISKIKIKGFRSFGPDEVTISVTNNLIAFIGLNSSGKTAALESLRKIFGTSITERTLLSKDFHIGKDEDPREVSERHLSIEVRLDFSESEKESIPHFFNNMVVDEEGENPYVRIRLEGTWTKSDRVHDGEIETNLYFIKVAEGEVISEDSKQIYPNHSRSLIQILYVPAIRKPSEQIKYASGSILYRVLKKINYDNEFRNDFDEKIKGINNAFSALPEFNSMQDSITTFWEKFHKDERYRATTLGFGGSDLDSILRKLEISFSPSPTNKAFTIDELGEGYRSLFYLTLVCALLHIEETLITDQAPGVGKPLLTILAIEEPENHIAPQLLGRVIKILKNIGDKDNSQVFLSSHTSSIVKRLDPESIFHFRITNHYTTQVNIITLPPKASDAYKYVKEAVHNYPEIYFAKLVVIGEGDSEDVIFNRLMGVMDTDFDDNIITFAPLGHRFVNHIWKLLDTLNIPYVTLLDLDIERNGGGWGRIKYVLNQLIESGHSKDELFTMVDGEVVNETILDKFHEREIKLPLIQKWLDALEHLNVYFSSSLDLDFLMLENYPSFYKKLIPTGGGPQIPNKIVQKIKFDAKVKSAIQATLKSEDATGFLYTDEQKELMIWYNYHFLGRGKPGTHIEVLSSMTNDEIRANLPLVFSKIFTHISEELESNVEEHEVSQ